MSNLNDNIDDPDCCGAFGKCSDSLEACNAYLRIANQSLKYCGVSCQKAHRPQHKRECMKLHDAALFKQPPAREECPICMLPMPFEESYHNYQACCGKTLCGGCVYAMAKATGDAEPLLCPFCRAIAANGDAAELERIKRRVNAKDACAIRVLGHSYEAGRYDLPQDHDKAMELWLRAGELGDDLAYCYVAKAYINAWINGQWKEMNLKKAKHYFEIAAMRGQLYARSLLGDFESDFESHDGNKKAVKHWMMAAEAGLDESLKMIRVCFMLGNVSKQEFAKALRAHKESKDEMESEGRAAFSAALASGSIVGSA